MAQLGPKPAFQQAIPHGMLVFACCTKWSFSGRLGCPEMDSFGDPKWTHLGTRNGPVWGPKMGPFGDRIVTHFGTQNEP